MFSNKPLFPFSPSFSGEISFFPDLPVHPLALHKTKILCLLAALSDTQSYRDLAIASDKFTIHAESPHNVNWQLQTFFVDDDALCQE